jgi:hypothetical protein
MTEFHKLFSTLFQETQFLGMDHLYPFISKFIFKKTDLSNSAALGISGIKYETFEKFLIEYGIYPTENLKEIIKELCTYNEFGIDLNYIGSSISFYFEEKNNSQFIPKSYKKVLPSDAIEDGIKINYDIDEDRIVYLKSYCILKEKMLTDRENAFQNFGFLLNKDKETSLIITQTCIHRNVRNVGHVENNMKKEYEELTALGFKINMTAIRKETDQSYLYIKKSL